MGFFSEFDLEYKEMEPDKKNRLILEEKILTLVTKKKKTLAELKELSREEIEAEYKKYVKEKVKEEQKHYRSTRKHTNQEPWSTANDDETDEETFEEESRRGR